MRVHKIMDQTGHSTIEFDGANTVELGEAMARFERMTGKVRPSAGDSEKMDGGYTAATRNTGDSDYHLVKDFKDTQDETLFVPAMAGG